VREKERFMSIPNITGAGRVAIPADTPAYAEPAIAASGKSPAASDSETDSSSGLQTPKPPRFPWLSRLSQQLADAAPQKAAFAPAPPLGDNLDHTA
jgi:hypothetical protein